MWGPGTVVVNQSGWPLSLDHHCIHYILTRKFFNAFGIDTVKIIRLPRHKRPQNTFRQKLVTLGPQNRLIHGLIVYMDWLSQVLVENIQWSFCLTSTIMSMYYCLCRFMCLRLWWFLYYKVVHVVPCNNGEVYDLVAAELLTEWPKRSLKLRYT